MAYILRGLEFDSFCITFLDQNQSVNPHKESHRIGWNWDQET